MFPICTSTYSLGWGASSPEALCRQATALGYTSICIADHNNLYGLAEFVSGAQQYNLTPIIGATITSIDHRQAIICLVQNDLGYRNLCRLISCRHCHADFDLTMAMASRQQGLIILSKHLKLLRRLSNIGVKTYFDQGLVTPPERQHLTTSAKQQGIAIACFHHCAYATPEDSRAHYLLRTIHLKKTISALQPRDYCSHGAMLSPQATSSIVAAGVLQANQQLQSQLLFSGPKRSLIMPPYATPTTRTPGEELQARARQGAKARYPTPLAKEVERRLQEELHIIDTMNFSSYFLVVQDIVRKRGTGGKFRRICGRGSGAASLVAYCLHITNVCPVKHNLYFARFLHPGRLDPPDIDVDFAWDERQDVLSEIFSKYKRHVAMVCNHVFYQPRMAVREIAKAYGLSEYEISTVSKRMHWLSSTGMLREELCRSSHLHNHDFSEPWPQIMEDAGRIIGLPRHLSVHPGGVVITPEPISHYVPVQQSRQQIPIIQWQKDGAEFFGLVKIDILGNRSLGVIRDAIGHIEASGNPFHEEQWQPEDDPATQQRISQGQTMGCFYIESPAMRLLQKKAGSGDFEQLVIQSSIIRPAANEFVREYVRRLHGGSWSHLHPALNEVLGESFGLMIYQEDVSRVAVALAGFSHERADGLRKVMSKKDKVQKLQDYEMEFQHGARSRGIPDKTIQDIWRMVMSFAGYSFCKPHSASYAKVSYQAAYLKTHYPAEFMAAVLANQGGYYSVFAYVSEAKRLGVTVKPPCVNHSQAMWTGSKGSIRAGLLSIKGLSHKSCKQIIHTRQRKPFSSMADFLSRACPNQDEAKALIHAGGLDSLSQTSNRTELLWDVAQYFYSRKWRTKKTHHSLSSQKLFAMQLPEPPSLPAPDFKRKSRREFKALGFLTTCHPLSFCLAKTHKRIMAKNIHLHDRQKVHIGGWLIAGKLVRTKKGDPMEFLSFEDETGLFETTFFPGAYRRCSPMLALGYPYLLSGRVDQDFGAFTIVVEQVLPL